MPFHDQQAFWDFNRSVRGTFRYARTAEQAEFLKAVEETSGHRAILLKRGMPLYRAQLGHEWRDVEIAPGVVEPVPAAYCRARMKPDLAHSSGGRVNAKGILCLYLATSKMTAAQEVRPLVGSDLSMGVFVLRKDVRIADCSDKLVGNLERFMRESWSDEDIEKQVWTDINDAFSKPTGREDAYLDYVPTQIIAETLRLQGFDGVGYRSSLEATGFNVALFNIEDAGLVNCGIERVRKVTIELSATGDGYSTSDDD